MPAPEIAASAWLNTAEPLSLETLRGRVVAIFAFQRKCEGCIQLSLPQARELWESFDRADLAVIGLHCPFESSSRSDKEALQQFLNEHNLKFPVALDADGESWQPETFSRYSMQGTPTLVLVGRNGTRRMQRMGHVSDILLGAAIQELIDEPA
jgi:peroxiredoxin